MGTVHRQAATAVDHRRVDRRIERDENEFGRTCSFFDAIFAVSMTLLATGIDPGPGDWTSWRALWDGVGFQLVAFGISFALIGAYWWGNHRFVASLKTLSPRLVITTLVMLAFVALVPFTTDALGNEGRSSVEIATVVYAANLAVVSLMATYLHLVARTDGLYRVPPTPEEVRLTLIDQSTTTVVFLVSIPVALLVSGEAARWCWLSLAFIGPLMARRTGRRARRARHAPEADGGV